MTIYNTKYLEDYIQNPDYKNKWYDPVYIIIRYTFINGKDWRENFLKCRPMHTCYKNKNGNGEHQTKQSGILIENPRHYSPRLGNIFTRIKPGVSTCNAVLCE